MVGLESPLQDDVARLVWELDTYLGALYPDASNHLLAIDALAAPSVRFFVARREGEALACGGLRIDGSGYGEVKRMFVLPKARGIKLGTRILHAIEEQARREGLVSVRLETGIHQPEALSLYRAAGSVERGPFGEYTADPLSVFMEKTL